MLQLEAPAVSIRVDIIGDRRALQPHRFRQYTGHGLMQTQRPFPAEPGRDRARMNARLEQRLVGIDVPHPAKERLVEQQRLDARLASLEQLQKFLRRNGKSVRTQSRDTRRHLLAPGDSPEMADVVEYQ